MKRALYISRNEDEPLFKTILEEHSIWYEHIDITTIQNIETLVTKVSSIRDIDFLIIKKDRSNPWENEHVTKAMKLLISFASVRPIFLLQQSEKHDLLKHSLDELQIRNVAEFDNIKYDLDLILTELSLCLSADGKSHTETIKHFQHIEMDEGKLHLPDDEIIRIGYIGTKPCVGVTTQSFMTYDFCRKKGLRPCIIVTPEFYTVLQQSFFVMEQHGEIRLDNKIIATTETENYNVFIYDFGTLTEHNKYPFYKMDVAVLVATAKKWDNNDLKNALHILGEHFILPIWFSFSSDMEIATLIKDDQQLVQYPTEALPFAPSPFGYVRRAFYNEFLLPYIEERCRR